MPRTAPPSSLQRRPPLPERSQGPTKRAGRPAGRHPDETRERILNVAEELFARNGYDGTSVRDVAAAAQLQTAAIGYHYPSKEELFDTVIRRRAVVMSEWRQRELQAMRARHGNAPIALDELVRAYVHPFYESASHGDPDWRHCAALTGRLANSTLGTGVASMLALCADTGRAQRLARPGRAARPLTEPFSSLVTFLVSGFLALPAEPARRARATKTVAREAAR